MVIASFILLFIKTKFQLKFKTGNLFICVLREPLIVTSVLNMAFSVSQFISSQELVELVAVKKIMGPLTLTHLC
jgi:hypothetical protein